MEFDWSTEDAEHRRQVREFLKESLPDDWEEISKGGPGSDEQAAFSKIFCIRTSTLSKRFHRSASTR